MNHPRDPVYTEAERQAEWNANRTAEQAYVRVIDAKTGSLINPSEEYLFALRAQLYHWLQEIDDTVSRLPSPAVDEEA